MLLKGKSQKGKNVIQRDGSVWIVVRSSASVQCFNGDSGFLIQPIDSPDKSRWIREKNDADFIF
jgi:hypothetical protein